MGWQTASRMHPQRRVVSRERSGGPAPLQPLALHRADSVWCCRVWIVPHLQLASQRGDVQERAVGADSVPVSGG